MKFLRTAVLLAVFAACVMGQTTTVTYQGKLDVSGIAANGNYDFEFYLYNAANGGQQLGPVITRNGVVVAEGIFSVNLDFGSNFPGANRFMEIRVRQAGGGAFTALLPRQPVNSAPYSIKSITADNATTATNAAIAGIATNFSGNLAGDVVGTQNATTVARLQNRSVASTAPTDGQVLKYNSASSQWVPGTDNTGGGGGGGTVTGVSAGTGLTGGGTGGNVTLAIANGGVGTPQLADGSVTDAKIASVSGAKVTGTVANATNFSGNLAGDVTGTQAAATVARLRGRNVAPTVPTAGQVLKFNGTTNQWEPATDETGGGGGGGTITGVTPGTGLTGGGTTGNVTVGIGAGGVGTGQLAEGSVVDSKIVTVSGAKVTGTVTNATNAVNATTATTATTATNSTQLGGVAANQYLQTNGNGSGLTNLNANSITSGTLANARLGQIPTANIADSAVTGAKIAGGQVVKNLNGLTDNVTLAAGSNISITPSGNTLTIASTGGGGGVSGSGTAGQVALWTGASTLGVSQISQSGGNIGVGTPGAPTDRLTVQTASDNYGVVHTNGAIAVGSYIGGSTGGGWFGTRSNHPLSFFTNNSGASLTIATNGNVGIGLNNPSTKLHVTSSAATTSSILGIATGNSGIGVEGRSSVGTGVLGEGSGSSDGVTGQTLSGTGVVGFSSFGRGVEAEVIGQGSIALKTSGTSFFKGDTSPLSAANAGSGTGIAIGSAGTLGYISSFDYGVFQPRTLLLNNSGGHVGINTNTPDQALSVNGNASKAGGGSWLAFSDERLKNIKGRFNGGLNAVMKLQPLRYEYKTDNAIGLRSEGDHIGFSAQAVEKIIPEAVTKTEQGYRLVNNDPIMWAMLNAIKEQQTQIEALKKINSALGTRLKTVERTLQKRASVSRRR